MADKANQIVEIRRYSVRRRERATGGSAGCWKGDDVSQIRLHAIFRGTADLLLPPVLGFESDPPQIVEPVLAMCLRAGAHYAGGTLRKYVPHRDTSDFLPFLMVTSCRLEYGRKGYELAQVRIVPEGTEAEAEDDIPAKPMYRLAAGTWTVRAEITVAHLPGVDEERVRELLAKAGTDSGLGALRPHLGGACGTFDVAALEVVSGCWPPPLSAVVRNKRQLRAIGSQIRRIREEAVGDDEDAEAADGSDQEGEDLPDEAASGA
jgi:hypothetical protein